MLKIKGMSVKQLILFDVQKNRTMLIIKVPICHDAASDFRDNKEKLLKDGKFVVYEDDGSWRGLCV
ncbi:MAG: hypothetical protein IIT58_12645 [Treponema sp.]|nr:hypothetical protein [Treponema sp.]